MNMAGMVYLGREWVVPPHALAVDLAKIPYRIRLMAAKAWHDRANAGKCAPELAGTLADPRALAATKETADFIAPFLDLPFRLDCNASDEDIRAEADKLAERFKQKALLGLDWRAMLADAGRMGVDADRVFVDQLKWIVDGRLFDDAALMLMGVNGIVGRLQDGKWWRRWLRKSLFRLMEGAYRKSGLIHRRAALYVSHEALARKQEQVRRQRAFFETMSAFCEETGEEFALEELWEHSLANPKIRRMELMARLKGFDLIAAAHNHYGCLVTLTCPSRFHRMKSGHGRPVANGKYDGSSMREGAEYLQSVWAQIRSALDRQGIRIYGFRVVEPHHDGTPHWHILCLMDEVHALGFKRVVARYGCRENREELGLSYFETDKARTAAAKNRQAALLAEGRKMSLVEIKAGMKTEKEFWAGYGFEGWKNTRASARVDFVDLDRRKGSFVGYVAKYLSKNIDGQNNDGLSIGEDFEAAPGVDAAESAKRVCAWASVQGIRQFQQIGGVPVTLYRELRRVEAYREESDAVLHLACHAADKGDWGKFVSLLGGKDGAFVRRKDLPLQLYKEEVAERNAYGEVKPERIRGVIEVGSGEFFASRVKDWVLKQGGNAAPWTCVNNCTKLENAGNRAVSDGLIGKNPTSPEEIAETLAACEPVEALPGGVDLHDESLDFDLYGYEGENEGMGCLSPSRQREMLDAAWAEALKIRENQTVEREYGDYMGALAKLDRFKSRGIAVLARKEGVCLDDVKVSSRVKGYRKPIFDTVDRALARARALRVALEDEAVRLSDLV